MFIRSILGISTFIFIIGCKIAPTTWQNSYDFDGDGKKDTIACFYSQGANCCYTLKIRLSSIRKWKDIEVEINGGYLKGLDLSQPENFNILDLDGDSLPEIVVAIDNQYKEKIIVDFIEAIEKNKYNTQILYK